MAGVFAVTNDTVLRIGYNGEIFSSNKPFVAIPIDVRSDNDFSVLLADVEKKVYPSW